MIMLDILRDSIWQFIGAILALIAIILILVQRKRKALSYKIISNTPLVKIKEDIKGRLQVLFDEKPVENIYLIIINFINSGNLPIKSADYESPVNLNFNEDVQLLTAEVIDTNPKTLEVSAKIEGTKVLLKPTLLNENDSITIKVLVNQFDGNFSVGGRIIGVKEIRELTERKLLKSFFIGNIAGVLMVGGIFILLKLVDNYIVNLPVNSLFFLILFSILVILLFWLLITLFKYLKKY